MTTTENTSTVWLVFKHEYDEPELQCIFRLKTEAEDYMNKLNKVHDTEDYFIDDWVVI